MDARSKGVNTGHLPMSVDGNGDFFRAFGPETDGSISGPGKRLRRFAMIADNGKATALGIEIPGKHEVSGAEAMLRILG